MAHEERANRSAVYVLLTAIVLVVAVVVGLRLVMERGPSYRTTEIEPPATAPAGAAGQEAAPAPQLPPLPPTPAVVAAPTPLSGENERPLVFGTVRNQQGQALAQARVTLRARQAGAEPQSPPLAEQRTDADGRYFLDAPGPGDYAVIAQAFGFAPLAENRLSFTAGNQSAEVNFTLSTGGLISGQVLGTANEPVEGALVVVSESPGITLRRRAARLRQVPRAFEPHVKIPTLDGQSLELADRMEESPYRATTDANGYYQVLGLPAGSYTVKATHARFAPGYQLGIPAGRRGVDFALSPGGSIAGSVLARTGGPVVGARVGVLYKLWVAGGVVRGTEAFHLAHSETFEVPTNSAGRYRLDRQPEGEYDLSVKAPGYLEAALEIDLARDEQRAGVDFLLEVESVVSGRLTDPEGRPLAHGTITATRLEEGAEADPLRLGGAEQVAESGADGSYRLDNLAPGLYWIAAGLPGYQSLERRQISVEAGALQSGVDFVLTPRAEIRGVVVDAGGRPLSGAQIRLGEKELEVTMERALELLADRGQMEEVETRTDADGAFSLGNLKNRSYQLEFSAQGYESQTLTLPAGMSEARIVLKKKAE